MEFTKENWENAPEGARLEYSPDSRVEWGPAHFIGYRKNGKIVIETDHYGLVSAHSTNLRIILPKRKVTVQLWRTSSKGLTTTYCSEVRWAGSQNWTLLGEHTFEIEGE